MTTARREQLRSIMNMAWSFARAEPGRAFADCLRGAWKLARRLSGHVASKANPFKAGAGMVHVKPFTPQTLARSAGGSRAYAADNMARIASRMWR